MHPASDPVHAAFEQTGDGLFLSNDLVPRLDVDDWVEVRCYKGEESTFVFPGTASGTQQQWSDSLGVQPHPGNVWFEADLSEERDYLLENAYMGHYTVRVTTPDVFEVGQSVRILDDNSGETNRIKAITGSILVMECPLEHTYLTVDNAFVFRHRSRHVAHVSKMDIPISDTEWYGPLVGDVDMSVPDADRRVNFRGTTGFVVTFRFPPLRGSTITVYIVKEEDCIYWVEQRFQSLDNVTLATNDDKEVTFKPGTGQAQVWWWNSTTEEWILVVAPASPADTDYVLVWDFTLQTVKWAEPGNFVCP